MSFDSKAKNMQAYGLLCVMYINRLRNLELQAHQAINNVLSIAEFIPCTYQNPISISTKIYLVYHIY